MAGRPAESETVVHLGIVLDLTVLVPLYGAAAVLLWRSRAWGFVLGVLALVAGTRHVLVTRRSRRRAPGVRLRGAAR